LTSPKFPLEGGKQTSRVLGRTKETPKRKRMHGRRLEGGKKTAEILVKKGKNTAREKIDLSLQPETSRLKEGGGGTTKTGR